MNKKGFTLVEVLITLSIVGIISALTIPSLILNIQKKYWANALSVKISDFENAIKNMMIEENTNDMFDTVFYDFTATSEAFLEKIKCLESFDKPGGRLQDYYDGKLFKINKEKAWLVETPASYNLKNGGKIYFTVNHDTPYYKHSEEDSLKKGTFRSNPIDIFIDVNGKALPNTLGRDIFCFVVDENGKLHAYGSKEHASFSLENEDSYWEKACSDSDKGDGLACTGRLVENNFVMDY